MTYTQIGLLVVVAVVLADLFLLRTRLVTRKVFWVAYAIVLFFQLLTNGVLTGLGVFRYDPDGILGLRIVNQPVEDLLMGFALCLLTMAFWVFWGRRGVQREPRSGPPLWASRARPGPARDEETTP